MAWEGSDRASRLPHDWQARRIRVLRRDGYRCQARLLTGGLCLQPASEVDHIVPGDDHRPENLRAICRSCHGRKTAAEGNAARKRLPPKRRPPERHPGAL